MAVKTDMSKTYDILEWEFIKLVFQRLSFHPTWVNWIMQCVTIVSYAYLINGSPKGKVKPQRGIRQDDPLSPYIFILCSEVLSGLCMKAQDEGSLQGIRVAKGSPRINHLLFADDTMFFLRTNKRNMDALKKILLKYELASGQCINKQKFAITFSRKAPRELKSKVKEELQIQHEGGVGKYLGLPEGFGRKKKDLFSSIVDKIRQKSISWSSKLLSPAGKIILLKSVLSSMPTYAMSCFKLPVSLCKRVQSALTRFWWDSKPNKRKMAWISWDKMTKSKQDGGLGLRDIQCFNDAMLAKMSWRIIDKPDCLLARILKGKYCSSEDFLNCTVPGSASHGWKGIMIGRDLIAKHIGWAIGNGEEIRVWQDQWLSTSSQSSPMGPSEEKYASLTVKELFHSNSPSWNKILIKRILPQYEKEILSLKPSKKGVPDKRIWLKHKSCQYTTKTGYYATLEDKNETSDTQPNRNFQWISDIWSIKSSPKIRMFLWKAAKGALPVGETLRNRQINSDPMCVRCGELESISHILFNCEFAKQVWREAPFARQIEPLDAQPFELTWKRLKSQICLPPTGSAGETLAPWICWNLKRASPTAQGGRNRL